jgi:threonine 3-dehydrogenase
LALAQKLGATVALDVRHGNLRDCMAQLGMKEGFDVGLEMSGNGNAFNELLEVMCHGGKVALLGIQGKSAAVDWDLVVFNGLTIKGIYGREMYETWYKMTSMIQSGLDISPVVTHHFPFDAYEQAFELMRSGQSGKIVLNWEAGVQPAEARLMPADEPLPSTYA